MIGDGKEVELSSQKDDESLKKTVPSMDQLNEANALGEPVVDATPVAPNGHSKSVITDRRKQLREIGLVTLTGLSGASSYIVMLFIAMPFSVHIIINTSNGCDPDVQSDCFAPTSESQQTYTMILTLLRLMTFLFGSLVGGMSDHFGRKPMLLFALLGYVATSICFVIGWVSQSIALFFLGGILLGMSSPLQPHGIAVISDISTQKELAKNLGIMQGGGYFFGLMLGAVCSLIISILTTGKSEGMDAYNQLFYSSYGLGFFLTFTVLIIAWMWLRESLHIDERSPQMNWTKANPFGFVGLITRTPYMFFIWLSAVCGWIGVGATEAVTGGWWLRRYAFTSISDFIQFVALTWVASGLGTAIMTSVYDKFVGLKGTIHVSTIMVIVMGVTFSFAPNYRISYIVVPLSFFSSSIYPATVSLLMSQVGPREKGALAGGIRSSEALGKLFGIIVFGNMFSAFIEPFTPDLSCVPSTFGGLNKTNFCECGVETCPRFNPDGSMYYIPSNCTLGKLSLSVNGKPSSYVSAEPTTMPIIPNFFVENGLMPRPEDCLGSGLVSSAEGFVKEMDRLWCVSTSTATQLFGSAAAGTIANAEMGCVGFDLATVGMDGKVAMNAKICSQNQTAPTCDMELYMKYVKKEYNLTNTFPAAQLIAANALAGKPETCGDQGPAELNLCLIGPISDFPGFIPFLYSVVVPFCGYICFLTAEIFFKKHDKLHASAYVKSSG